MTDAAKQAVDLSTLCSCGHAFGHHGASDDWQWCNGSNPVSGAACLCDCFTATWPTTAPGCEECGHSLADHLAEAGGCNRRCACRAHVTTLDPLEVLHTECGHAWKFHGPGGCHHLVNRTGGRGTMNCPCKVGRPSSAVRRTNERGGMKDDIGKPRMDLVEPLWQLDLGKLAAFGAAKYEPEGWKKLDPADMYAALQRHALAARSGETHDPETGLSHWTAVAFNAMALWYFESEGKA